MIGSLKRRWWFGPFVAGFAIAAILTIQATITIAGAVIHATSAKRLTWQEPEPNSPRSFEERWQPAFSTNWQRLRTTVSIHE